jgi:hypothetical protein
MKFLIMHISLDSSLSFNIHSQLTTCIYRERKVNTVNLTQFKFQTLCRLCGLHQIDKHKWLEFNESEENID